MFRIQILLVLSLALTACTQAADEESASNASYSSYSESDIEFCNFILRDGLDSFFDDYRNLRPYASYWVLLEDEKLVIALRDLHNMDFDRSGATRSFNAVLDEYSLKKESIFLRCQYLVDDPRLLNNGVTN